MSDNPFIDSEIARTHKPVDAVGVMSEGNKDGSTLYEGVEIVGLRDKDVRGSKIKVFDLRRAGNPSKWEVHPTDVQVNKYEEELQKLKNKSE